MNKRIIRSEKGQILVIIFVIMVIALSIGLVVSTRFIKTVSIITKSDDSSRALAIAEAAIEHLLILPISTLEDYVQNGTCGSNCYLEITGADGQTLTANVNLSRLGNSSEPFLVELKTDESSQILLNPYPMNQPVYICWNSSEMSVSGLYVYGTQGNYLADAFSYNSASSSHLENGFDAAVPMFGYSSCLSITSKADSEMLRLKAFYHESVAVVIPDTGVSLPSQGILIESTGYAGDSTKKVTVIITEPILPVQFDYVLYQKSTSEPLSN